VKGTALAALSDLRLLASGLDHPEGIATGPDGLLYAGGEAGQVYRIDPASGEHEQIADTGGFILGLCHDATGRIYACDMGRLAVVRVDPASGAVETYCDSASGTALTCPNWAAFDAEGALWLSDSGTESLEIRDGRLLRVPPGGGDAEVLDLPPLHFPNGLAVSPNGAVYVLESFTPRLSRLGENGLETIVDLPGVVPDGLAIDADGGFVVACYYPFRILRITSTREVETILDDPTGIHIPMPTNVSFFGPGLSSLAIASLGGYAVKALDVLFSGVPLTYPEL
jgi:sugar lactone lactonase YvrE